MSYQDLISTVAAKHGTPKAQVADLARHLFDSVVEAVNAGQDVSIPGFGKFKAREAAARQGRNPKTGETIEIAASRSLAFSPASKVKAALSEALGKR